jgi:O-acetyl-ADP-ribose deacetylase (regulator of RNase III)
MMVLVSDRNKRIVDLIKTYDCTFEAEIGDPLAFDIDAVVSPANTAGIMNGGYDATLRNYFGVSIEYRVRESLKEKPLAVGEARAIQTAHKKVQWLIVAPTVSIAADGLSGHASVAYSAAYSAVTEANRVGAKKLGMTGLGTGAGGLNYRDAIIQQCDGIEDALQDIASI